MHRKSTHSSLVVVIACLPAQIMRAGEKQDATWKSFELVYYDAKANGVTPFNVDAKSAFDIEGRIEYLQRYAKALAERAGKAPELYAIDVVPTQAARERARQIKEKPLSAIRQELSLKYWRWKLENHQAAGAARDQTWVVKRYQEEALWNETEAPRMFSFNRAVWLRTHFRGPRAERVLLALGSIIDVYDIWLNGRHVAGHRGFEPVVLDITPFVEPEADNVIAIRIEDKPKDQIGVADEMRVLGVSQASLSDLFVKTEQAQGNEVTANLDVEVTQRGHTTFEGQVRLEITPWFPDERQKPIFSGIIPVRIAGDGVARFSRKLSLRGIDLWKADAPRLYLATTTLQDSMGTARDDLKEVVGFRRIEQRRGRFFLNGEPWFMKSFGENLGFAPGFNNMGEVCPPDEWIVQDLLLAKQANANTIRIHPWGYQTDAGQYTDVAWPVWSAHLLANSSTNYERIAWIADQLGIGLVWGTRLWTLRASDFEKKYVDDSWEPRLEPSLRHVRNRPSILVYEGLNEVGFSATRVPGKLADLFARFCRRYLELVNRIDDSRLVIPDTPWGPAAYKHFPDKDLFTSIENTFWTTHSYLGWYDNLPDRPLRDKLEDRPFVLMESGAEAMPDWRLYRGLRWYGIWLNNGVQASRIERERIGRPFRILGESEAELSQANQGLAIEKTVFATRFSPLQGVNINLIADGLMEANYHKGVSDINRKAKLGYFAAQMAYQPLCAAGAGLDFVIGSEDRLHLQVAADAQFGGKSGQLRLEVVDDSGVTVDQKQWPVVFNANDRVTFVADYAPRFPIKGFYLLRYKVTVQ